MTGQGRDCDRAMASRFRFDAFELDCDDRRLSREGVAVELNARYLDALALLVRESGRLVSKDRFLDEVWRGVPVTDEALTQCVKTLRRQLGDEAARPRFIETVPKHGYRFIAAVEPVAEGAPTAALRDPPARTSQPGEVLLLGSAATIGGGVAGLLGGLVYGFAGASQPLSAGMGAFSVLLVLVALTMLVGVVGGAGVGFGMASARRAWGPSWPASVAGGGLGGMVVGGLVKLLGLDAFSLLVGRSPGDVTGAAEGLLLGAAVGLGAWVAGGIRGNSALRRGVAAAAVLGGAAGLVIPLLGGRMMGGSLDLLADRFPGSRLRLDRIGGLLGEDGFGPLAQVVTSTLEGLLFAGGVVGAMLLARRHREGERR